MSAWLSVGLWVWIAGCAPATRVRRALAPETFVTPRSEAPRGEVATVLVDSGWEDEPAIPYRPVTRFTRDGVSWFEPVPITDRGSVEIVPRRPEAEIAVYARHTGLVQRDFRPVLTRSGTVDGELPTTIRFLPAGPLGAEPVTLALRDLHDVYNEEPLEDGDLLLIEVGVPGEDVDRYLFRSLDFGLRTRIGAGVMVRTPVPWFAENETDTLSPAFTLSLAVGYRPRTRRSGLSFVGERFALVGSVGVGSAALDVQGLDQQLQGAFNAALIGGGIEVFELVNVQLMGNVSAPFRDDLGSDLSLAFGVDAVQLARFADHLGDRLIREHRLVEEDQARDRARGGR
ncbi:MAG: hypothetical protein ABMB14_03720 [Myxococcota bacterium]